MIYYAKYVSQTYLALERRKRKRIFLYILEIFLENWCHPKEKEFFWKLMSPKWLFYSFLHVVISCPIAIQGLPVIVF